MICFIRIACVCLPGPAAIVDESGLLGSVLVVAQVLEAEARREDMRRALPLVGVDEEAEEEVGGWDADNDTMHRAAGFTVSILPISTDRSGFGGSGPGCGRSGGRR